MRLVANHKSSQPQCTRLKDYKLSFNSNLNWKVNFRPDRKIVCQRQSLPENSSEAYSLSQSINRDQFQPNFLYHWSKKSLWPRIQLRASRRQSASPSLSLWITEKKHHQRRVPPKGTGSRVPHPTSFPEPAIGQSSSIFWFSRLDLKRSKSNLLPRLLERVSDIAVASDTDNNPYTRQI